MWTHVNERGRTSSRVHKQERMGSYDNQHVQPQVCVIELERARVGEREWYGQAK